MRKDKPMNNLITGSFSDPLSADRAVQKLQQLGYPQNDITVMMTDETRSRYFEKDHGAMVAEGAGAGAGIGGVLGAIVAGVVATGSIVAVAATGGTATPLLAGPLAAALAGAGAGGIGGGMIGALVGLGFPKERADQFRNDLDRGRIIVGVDVRGGNDNQVRQAMLMEGAQNVRRELPGAVS
jgi:hypothetical protein